MKDSVGTALRVLVAWNEGLEPMSADVAILQEAFPAWTHMPVDELACQVIRNLSGIAFSQLNPDNPAINLLEDNSEQESEASRALAAER